MTWWTTWWEGWRDFVTDNAVVVGVELGALVGLCAMVWWAFAAQKPSSSAATNPAAPSGECSICKGPCWMREWERTIRRVHDGVWPLLTSPAPTASPAAETPPVFYNTDGPGRRVPSWIVVEISALKGKATAAAVAARYRLHPSSVRRIWNGTTHAKYGSGSVG